MDQSSSITVDGISYDIKQFSQPLQQAVGIYNSIQVDLQKGQLDVIKCQAALQTIGNQISEAVKSELDAAKQKASDEQKAAAGEGAAANDDAAAE